MGWGNTKPNGSWFKLGFPSGYVTDVIQNLHVLCELGQAENSKLDNAVDWLLSKQDSQGRWRNQYAYNGKTWVGFEKQGHPSKWVLFAPAACSKRCTRRRRPSDTSSESPNGTFLWRISPTVVSVSRP